MEFGSRIYPSRDELPKFTSDDLKGRAGDPSSWYDTFAANGFQLPEKPNPSNRDAFAVFDAGEGRMYYPHAYPVRRETCKVCPPPNHLQVSHQSFPVGGYR